MTVFVRLTRSARFLGSSRKDSFVIVFWYLFSSLLGIIYHSFTCYFNLSFFCSPVFFLMLTQIRPSGLITTLMSVIFRYAPIFLTVYVRDYDQYSDLELFGTIPSFHDVMTIYVAQNVVERDIALGALIRRWRS